MAFRFRRSIKLAPGIRLNVGKRGMSISAGVRGASVTYGTRGTYANIGLPGTGLSYRTKLSGSSSTRQTEARPSSGRGAPTIPMDIVLALQDDGTVMFRDTQGQDIPPRLIRQVREQLDDRITAWLEKQCEVFNQGIDDLLNIHRTTPPPDTQITYTSEPFKVPKPQPPLLRKPGFWSRLFKKRRERVARENADAHRAYEDHLNTWEQQKTNFEQGQEQRRRLVEVDRYRDVEAMQQFLGDALGGIVWARETSVSFQLEGNGQTVFLDVDLPEIEDMPEQQASVATRGTHLLIKDRSERQRRQEYVTHIHGIGFRLIGEVFVALPTVATVVLSAYSQRPDKATGRIHDEYLYSVKITRDAWSHIDFRNLEMVDVIEALGRFEIRRKMTKTGIFTSIEPYQPSQEVD